MHKVRSLFIYFFSYELQVTSYELQVTSYELQVTSCYEPPNPLKGELLLWLGGLQNVLQR